MTTQRFVIRVRKLGRNTILGSQDEIPNTIKENRILVDDDNDRL